ncbi:hypothetical protein AUC69_11660 [Methyloceanibacter superfactus]|uniref:DUF995 domain-containing protein n=1 Tax=Methyloceanibacter superfactus TaxID=1774969 RepID=A0A1E3VW24_9HYPH|nr:hypothetical protein [Methyloceanibacter superfactus]ODR97737.1 hypothetical protein AUC69_11660 [Methyloceanibacter superfactus]
MPPLKAFGLFVSALVAASLALSGARAGGSLTLADIMQEFRANGTFIAEVKAELKSKTLKADKVSCFGSRFGNHFVHLVGARSVPYECQVGKRTLSIDGEVVFYDKKGRALDFFGEGTPENAVRFETKDLNWTWDKPDDIP